MLRPAPEWTSSASRSDPLWRFGNSYLFTFPSSGRFRARCSSAHLLLWTAVVLGNVDMASYWPVQLTLPLPRHPFLCHHLCPYSPSVHNTHWGQERNPPPPFHAFPISCALQRQVSALRAFGGSGNREDRVGGTETMFVGKMRIWAPV